MKLLPWASFPQLLLLWAEACCSECAAVGTGAAGPAAGAGDLSAAGTDGKTVAGTGDMTAAGPDDLTAAGVVGVTAAVAGQVPAVAG